MAVLLAVNVGLPQDIEWQGKTVHTAVWKRPVQGRVMVRRLNIDGDGQGDLAGHGGEHRAVMVYQAASYRYWEAFFQRPTLDYGSFGENLTVDGLPDDEVCIGDRYRIGEALLEVTQPRVTCYRVALRMNEPRMANLLVSHRRPGFYFRVIEEGLIGAGDTIAREQEGSGMTVAEIDALLYLPGKSPIRLKRAAQIPALSRGWKQSFEELLAAGPEASGNVALGGPASAPPAWSGFREVRVTAIREESALVRSFVLEPVDGHPLPRARAGQFIVLRLQPPAPRAPIIRSYSLSDTSLDGRYRISVKRGTGEGSRYLHDDIHEGDTFGISAARGTFNLVDDQRPVVLWGAGIGITPLLSMLHELAAAPPRPIYWLYGARDGTDNPFSSEIDTLLKALPEAKHLLSFSKPTDTDRKAPAFDIEGHIGIANLIALGVPNHARIYLCGPTRFLQALREQLPKAGYPDVMSELFGAQEGFQPGVVGAQGKPPHAPAVEDSNGPIVAFVRSGIAVRWSAATYPSLLELAEACDVPVRWSCRSGVCHSCETALIGGDVAYTNEPPDPPAEGRVLICCSRPVGDMQIDL
ncbi:MOSC and FAD-binding oxidoreductase domain-containing protein [Luteibacter aegosomatissinici]|uniref:MOSC and FAD-binding oxidoreductase domain-containing protein n=1 Tax=Luteibacter aegosomatissinici TaxID=2911539 RepID=UPI001FF92541|nr:MOSC and FAD-binding oxidoreductase domain-containing protein [Luteibacter aegosomatissinici]UPG94596.1 MOSC and FAD-binding oxidoreductase domain-containing protein [Luteibacter aegosomatissinici]